MLVGVILAKRREGEDSKFSRITVPVAQNIKVSAIRWCFTRASQINASSTATMSVEIYPKHVGLSLNTEDS